MLALFNIGYGINLANALFFIHHKPWQMLINPYIVLAHCYLTLIYWVNGKVCCMLDEDAILHAIIVHSTRTEMNWMSFDLSRTTRSDTGGFRPIMNNV